MTSMLLEEGEHLTTGWEDDLAPTDSLVRQAVLAHVSWARALTTAARGTFAEGPDWCAGRGGAPSALHNWAIVTRPPRDWAQTVGAVATAYPDGVAALVISPFPTPDLTRHGLGLVGHPPLMFRPTTVTTTPATSLDDGETPVATSAAHSAAGVTVVENGAVLAGARGQRAGAALTWAATTAWPGQSAVLIASDDGQPVYERLGYLRL